MRLTKVRMLFASVAALALMVGVGSAIAATGSGGKDLKQAAAQITGRASFEAAVAKNLGTTTAKLEAAVKAAAKANIAAALAADEITAAEAATLNDALADGTVPAMRLATAEGVAKELDTTVAKLNAAFSSAAKAQATARVDQALEGRDDHRGAGGRDEGEDRRRNVPGLRCRWSGSRSRWPWRAGRRRDGLRPASRSHPAGG